MLWKWLGNLAVPAAGGLAVFVGAASVAYYAQERGAVVLDAAPIDLSQAISTVDYEVRPILRNDSNRTVRIVGAASLCGGQGCADVKGLPVALKPGESHALAVHYQAGGPGALDLELPIYTDLPSQPEITLRLTGMVHTLEPEAANP